MKSPIVGTHDNQKMEVEASLPFHEPPKVSVFGTSWMPQGSNTSTWVYGSTFLLWYSWISHRLEDVVVSSCKTIEGENLEGGLTRREPNGFFGEHIQFGEFRWLHLKVRKQGVESLGLDKEEGEKDCREPSTQRKNNMNPRGRNKFLEHGAGSS